MNKRPKYSSGGGNHQGRGGHGGARANHQHRQNNARPSHSEDDIPRHYLDVIRSLGNTPEDLEKWRAERRRKFPRSHPVATVVTQHTPVSSNGMPLQSPEAQVSNKAAASLLGSHFAAYASEDEGDDVFDSAEVVSTMDSKSVVQRLEIDVNSEKDHMTREHSGAASTDNLDGKESPAIREARNVSKSSITNQNGGRQECHHFTRTGQCKFGSKCRHEHIPRNQQSTHNSTPSSSGSFQRAEVRVRSHKELMQTLLADVSYSVVMANGRLTAILNSKLAKKLMCSSSASRTLWPISSSIKWKKARKDERTPKTIQTSHIEPLSCNILLVSGDGIMSSE